MTEEELSVLNRIKEWSVLLKIYYGILFFSFVTVGLVSLLLTLLSLWTNMMLFLSLLLLFFLGLGGVGTAILDDYKWSLFSGICRRMKKSATVESYECWKKEMNRGIQKSLAIDTRLFPMALKCIQVEYECCLDDHRFCQINVGKRRVDLLPNDWMAIICYDLI